MTDDQGAHGGTKQRPLNVGIQLPEAERVVPWQEMAAMARLAEDVGFDSLWIGDHLMYRGPGEEPRGPWEAWSLLAALAAVTTRVALGPFVACALFHNPAILAKKAATIDEISGGRLILGLGAGWHEPEFTAYGVPFDHRVSRFEEAFTIIRTLLREGEIDFAGRYYAARDCVLVPRGPRPEGPPLMVGSLGERMLRITLPHVQMWNAWYADYGNDWRKLPAILERLDRACRAAGRDPASLQRSVAVLIALPGGTGRWSVDPADDRAAPIRGTPEQIAEELRCFARVGVQHVQLVLDPITPEAIEAMAPVLEALEQG